MIRFSGLAFLAFLVTLHIAGCGAARSVPADVPVDVPSGDPGVSQDIPAADVPEVDVSRDTTDPEDVPDAADAADAPDAADAGTDPGLPPRICRAGTAWAPGARAFANVTAGEAPASNLRALGVAGVRLGAVDWDGDGRPDLAVRGYAMAREDWSEGGARYTWLLRNQGDLQFRDATRDSGFLAVREGEGGRVAHAVVFGDVDNDGDLDVFTGITMDPNPAGADTGDRFEIVLNQGDGTFRLTDTIALPAVSPKWRPPLMGASFTDFDADGNLDLWIGYGFGPDGTPEQDRLYRGDGTGRFEEVTESVGLKTQPWFIISHYEQGLSHRGDYGSTACDLNDDGLPELLSSGYGRYFNGLWQAGRDGDGGVVFADRSFASGFASDERVDWTTNLNARCFCKLVRDGKVPDAEVSEEGKAACDGVPAPPSYFSCTSANALRWRHAEDRKPYRLGGNTFTTLCADIDDDGHMDLVNFEIVHWDVGDTSDPTEVLLNNGEADPTFRRPGNAAMGLVRDWGRIDWNAGDMTGAVLDFDNDGRKDLLIASSDYPGTRAFLYRQQADGTFVEVPAGVGIDHRRAHGVAVADFDGDGDVDVALGHGRSRCEPAENCYETAEVHLFRNEIGQDGNWLRVALAGGAGTNRAAIGARVEVTAGGRTQVQEIGGGYGHLAIQHDLVLHFGLGESCDVERVVVRWPDRDRTTQEFRDVRANYRILLTQGRPDPQYLDAP